MFYYFNFVEGDITIVDDVGHPCADVEDALLQAVKAARSVIADTLKFHGAVDLGHYVEIVDAKGRQIATVGFDEAILAR